MSNPGAGIRHRVAGSLLAMGCVTLLAVAACGFEPGPTGSAAPGSGAFSAAPGTNQILGVTANPSLSGMPGASGSPGSIASLQVGGVTYAPNASLSPGSSGSGGPGITLPPTPAFNPPSGGTVTIAAAGDIACDPASNTGAPANCDQAATANLIGQLDPTAVLPLGDNQYEDGTLSAFQTVFGATWGRYLSKMYPAVGNHEYLTAGASGYFNYFHLPAYYAFNLGSWHLISLDSECSYVGGCGAGSAEERWLLNNLAANPSLCTLVYWHEPRWSSGEWQDATQMSAIWNDLVANHVDVVLSGHNHDYERFVPLNANGQPDPTGVQEFVVGTGGKNHTGFVTAPLTGEVIRDDSSYGVLDMTLGPTSYSWRYVPAPGFSFTDSGSASCR